MQLSIPDTLVFFDSPTTLSDSFCSNIFLSRLRVIYNPFRRNCRYAIVPCSKNQIYRTSFHYGKSTLKPFTSKTSQVTNAAGITYTSYYTTYCCSFNCSSILITCICCIASTDNSIKKRSDTRNRIYCSLPNRIERTDPSTTTVIVVLLSRLWESYSYCLNVSPLRFSSVTLSNPSYV